MSNDIRMYEELGVSNRIYLSSPFRNCTFTKPSNEIQYEKYISNNTKYKKTDLRKGYLVKCKKGIENVAFLEYQLFSLPSDVEMSDMFKIII